MKDILRALFLSMLLALPAKADEASAIPAEPSQAAMVFVESFSDNHLAAMLTRIGARQPTMVAMSNLHGQLLAAVFDAEVVKSVKKYGPDWKRNMARAWSGLLDDEELTSLSTDGAASPHSDKYKSRRAEAGKRMQALSQDLFGKALAETIQNTMKALAEPAEKDGETTGKGKADPATKSE